MLSHSGLSSLITRFVPNDSLDVNVVSAVVFYL